MIHPEIYQGVRHEPIPDREEPYFLGEEIKFKLKLTNETGEYISRPFFYIFILPGGQSVQRNLPSITLAPGESRIFDLGEPIYLGFLGSFLLGIIVGQTDKWLLNPESSPPALTEHKTIFSAYSRDKESFEFQKRMEQATVSTERSTIWTKRLTIILAILTAALIILTVLKL